MTEPEHIGIIVPQLGLPTSSGSSTEPQPLNVDTTPMPDLPSPGPTVAAPDEVVDQYDPTKAGESPYDSPDFQQELKEGIQAQIEGWQKDWSIRINALMEALGLSRPEVMLYLLLMQTGTLRGMASGFQRMWNADPAQRRRAMQDKLLEMELQVTAKALGLELEVSEEPAVSPNQAAKQAARGWKIQ